MPYTVRRYADFWSLLPVEIISTPRRSAVESLTAANELQQQVQEPPWWQRAVGRIRGVEACHMGGNGKVEIGPQPSRGLPRATCVTRSLAFVLSACLAALSPPANASPPDPVWVPGIFDGGDYDDEIALLTDIALDEHSPVEAVDPVPLVFKLVAYHSASHLTDLSLLGFHLRSPPSSQASPS
jgi:hypothetical protein